MPPKYTQVGRPLSLTTPLGADVLLLETLSGVEALSELFRFELSVLTAAPASWTFDQLLGKSVTVSLLLPDGSSRYLNGIVNRIAQGGLAASALGTDKFVRYWLEVVPQLWLLTRSHQSRIFQQTAVTDILKKVLTGITLSWQTQETYKPRDYCVQYNETDFAFASRLMEEEGIYYYFDHANGSHKMVVGDKPQSYLAVPGAATISYQTTEGGLHPDDRIMVWKKTQEIRSGKLTLWDHCFERPGQNLEATTSAAADVTAGTVSHKQNVANNTSLEIYDYPGRYAQRFDGINSSGGDRAADVQNIGPDGERTVAVRLKQELLPGLLIEGEGNARNLSAGHKFTLSDHFDANGAYVVTRVKHQASQEGAYTSGQASPLTYTGAFQCIPAAVSFVPAATTPRPCIAGPQSAVVVGPSGNEIFTDKYGRVKVQFAWDRTGKKDASSSCWVRVGTVWAGKQWGAIHIPRVGQEVIVAFEEGDPDRPIIVGSVYNAEQMPPYPLPDNMTQSGVKSQSTTDGAGMSNELRFEDKKGSEEVYFHAQKDFTRVVENNDSLTVGSSDSNKCPAGSQTISIYKDRTETVETGNESVTIKKGNRTVTVSEGNDTHTVTKGNRVVEIDTGNDTLTIKTGNQTIAVKAGSSSTEAMQSITLKVGSNSIKIDQSGITLQGMVIKVQGQTQVQVQGPIVQASADGMLQLKGGLTTIN